MKMKVLTEQDIEEYEPEKIINLTGIYYVKPVFFKYFKAISNTAMNVVTIFFYKFKRVTFSPS